MGGCALGLAVSVTAEGSTGIGISVGKVVADGVAEGSWVGVEVVGAGVGTTAGLHALNTPVATTARKVVAHLVINCSVLANRLSEL